MNAPALERAADRVRRLATGYELPEFAHVPDPDAALFLCAVDHRTGYACPHRVGDRGPFAGSELMWEVALASAHERPELLRAGTLRDVSAADVAAVFAVEGDTVGDPERRAALWRNLATGLLAAYDGMAAALLGAASGRLGGGEGLIERLAAFEAYADPLAKKGFLFAKICARRGWFAVSDPGSWEVCADNVLMRLALRSGLVEPGPLAQVRPATRDALKALASAAGVSPPVLDDLLWELGREDPDLLGSDAGDLHEPERDPASPWY